MRYSSNLAFNSIFFGSAPTSFSFPPFLTSKSKCSSDDPVADVELTDTGSSITGSWADVISGLVLESIPSRNESLRLIFLASQAIASFWAGAGGGIALDVSEDVLTTWWVESNDCEEAVEVGELLAYRGFADSYSVTTGSGGGGGTSPW